MFGRIQSAWARDTAYKGKWHPDCPAKGQCAVTALLIQELLGGGIIKASYTDVESAGTHYWNILPDGTIFDLTKGQFTGFVKFENIAPREREHLLADQDTARRYSFLRYRVLGCG